MVYRVTCLIYEFGLDYEIGLDYKDFSSMLHDVTHPNIVYRFNLDNEDFSSILYALAYGVALIHWVTYSSTYNTWRSNLVHVPTLGHII